MHGERAVGPSRGLGRVAGPCNPEKKVAGYCRLPPEAACTRNRPSNP